MNYYIDLEFYENGIQIFLISIAIVCEDGRELYYENADFYWDHVPEDHWIQKNVRPHLWTENYEMGPDTPAQFDVTESGVSDERFIARRIESFCLRPDKCNPVFHSYFSAYDWVAFCQIFGSMSDLPRGFPMFCMDLKQMMVERGLGGEWKQKHCPDPQDEHHALADARWNKKLHECIMIHDANRNTFKP